jgi:uncharacterized tellurite resistance protein B-like protein
VEENNQSQMGWFQRMLYNTLERYAETASADKLRRKYPGLPKDVIANKYIAHVSRATLVAGAISGAVISVAELPALASAASTIASVFAASPVTVPILVVSVPIMLIAFGAEMVYTVRMQIRMAYDLFLLYDLSLDPNDPKALWEAFLIGLGAKGGETATRALRVTMPKIAAQQVRKSKWLRSGMIRRYVEDWTKRLSRELARRYLAEGFLLKMVVPGLSIVLSAGWNYSTTQGLGKLIVWQVRSRAMARDLIDKIDLGDMVSEQLLLNVTLSILQADKHFSAGELEGYKRLIERLKEIHPTSEPKDDEIRGDWTRTYAQLTMIQDPETRKMIYDVMQAMVILDGRVSRREMKYLKQVAELYSFSLDKGKLKAGSKLFVQPRPGRNCLIVAIIIASLLALTIISCVGALVVMFIASSPASG